MLKVLQTVLALVFAGSVLMAVGAPVTGSCPSAAQAISMTGTEQERRISLVSAYSEETGLYDVSNQVFFLKATLSRSRAYSVWLTDKSGDTIDIFRLICPCFVTGQAAGVAAALAAQKGVAPRSLAYSDIRSALDRQTVYL